MNTADRRPARPGRVSADHLQRVALHLTQRDRRIGFRSPWQRGAGSTPYHRLLDEAGAHVVAD